MGGDGSINATTDALPFAMAGDPISEEEALRRLRLTDDPSAQYYAAWWLGRNRRDRKSVV